MLHLYSSPENVSIWLKDQYLFKIPVQSILFLSTIVYRRVANSSRSLLVAAPLVTFLNLLSKIDQKKYWKSIVAAATISDFTVNFQ